MYKCMNVCIALRPSIEKIYFTDREGVLIFISKNVTPIPDFIGCVYLDHRLDLVDVDLRPILSQSF